ncbi:hypothetical protein [Treponema bryantii]|uniref:hypothetical protein n=1 Tax=Treponema bryantii TaxID=163 RepID=UPI0012DF0311|nr:hypothetical protein [Treponema bryantii]
MHDFLISEAGGSWNEKEIAEFPNGVSEFLLECALNGAIEMGSCEGEKSSCRIFLYICTERPVKESKPTVWLGGEELQKEVINHFVNLEIEGIDFQVIYDVCADYVSDEARGYEKP